MRGDGGFTLAGIRYPFRVSSGQASDGNGGLWDVRVLGQERDDGTWVGWLEFENPLRGTLRTERETTQSNRDGLVYWATGLEPIYLEGALSRAS